MPIPSPVHGQVAPLCQSMRWKDWAGYYAVCTFEPNQEREYIAIRNSAALIDVSPLFKYVISGPDAGAFLARVLVKDVRKLKVGQVTYLCWCDEQGKVIDDGTVTRVNETDFRLTAAEPSLAWFEQFKRGYQIEIQDVSANTAALSVQGPLSRDALQSIVESDLTQLKYFRMVETKIAGHRGSISRTGYTGDLGYEIWVAKESAEAVYAAIRATGAPFGLRSCGLDAMDTARIEAGFIMNGVDYYSAHHCLIEARKSSPYELGLGWCVDLAREDFIGRTALQREKIAGPTRALVGLEMDYEEYESLFAAHDLPPELCSAAWRSGRPIYNSTGQFIGQATSGTWSPLLKKNLALATVKAPYAALGTKLRFEVTVEYERKTVTATVVALPFFNPERKRA